MSRAPQELLKTETPVEGDNVAHCETQTGDIKEVLKFGFVLVSTQRSCFSGDFLFVLFSTLMEYIENMFFSFENK